MNSLSYLEILKLAAPEAIITLTVLLVLGADLTVLRGKSIAARFNGGVLISVLGCVAAMFALDRSVVADLGGGMLVVEDTHTSYMPEYGGPSPPIWVVPMHSGVRPSTVVPTVIRIGRSRSWPARNRASSRDRPRLRSWLT